MSKDEKDSFEPVRLEDTYYIRPYHLKTDGTRQQYKLSLKTKVLRQANQIAGQIKSAVEAGLINSFEAGTEGKKIFDILVGRPGLSYVKAIAELREAGFHKKLDEAITQYLDNCKSEHSARTLKNEERAFKNFLIPIKAKYVHEVTQEQIERWRNKRIETVAKPTVNRELKMVKRFFAVCVDNNYAASNPAKKVNLYKEDDKAIKYLSEEEQRKLLEASPDDLRKIITFFLLTGLRYGELCNLEWSDIDLRRRQIIIQAKEGWRPKGIRKRIIPMHPTLEEIIKTLPRKDGCNYVFPDDDWRCAEGGLRNRIYRVFESAKVKGNVKDLRSTFASNLVMSGVPLYTVSKLLGHSDTKITEKHYAHLSTNYLQGIMTDYRPEWDKKQLPSEAAAS